MCFKAGFKHSVIGASSWPVYNFLLILDRAELRPELYFFETETLWCFFELFWGGRFWHGLHSGSHLFIFEDFTKLRKESN